MTTTSNQQTDGQMYLISMRTVRHYAKTEDSVTICECGMTDRDPRKLAQRHARSRKATPGLTALPEASVSSRRERVDVTVTAGPLAEDATKAALVLAFGRDEYARLAHVASIVCGDVLYHTTYRVTSAPVAR